MRPQPIASLIASPLAKLPGVDGVSSGSAVDLWILAASAWNDNGVWKDTGNWSDGEA